MIIDLLLQKIPTYLGLLVPVSGFACFLAFRRASSKRDEEFKRNAEKLLDVLDAERRRHAKMYSVHREIERRSNFDRSTDNKENYP